jgi:hypothetical protein
MIGSYITAQVMSFNHGCVGVIYTSPRLKMPETITEVAGLLPPVLKLIYNCSQIVKNMQHI